MGIKCECGKELTSNELYYCDGYYLHECDYYECICGKMYYARDLMQMLINEKERAEKAEAELLKLKIKR